MATLTLFGNNCIEPGRARYRSFVLRQLLALTAGLAILYGPPLAAQTTGRWEVTDTTQLRHYLPFRSALAAADGQHLVRMGTQFIPVSDIQTKVYSLILRSTDGGESWLEMWRDDTKGDNLLAIAHPTPEKLVVVGGTGRYGPDGSQFQRGFIQHSNDGGSSWQRLKVSGLESRVMAVAMNDADRGVALKWNSIPEQVNSRPWHNGSLLRTTDGWQTLQEITMPAGRQYLPQIYSPADGVIFLFGRTLGGDGFSLWRSDNGGASWAQSVTVFEEAYEFDFIDAQRGWAAGRRQQGSGGGVFRDVVLHTTDGGMHWVEQLDQLHDAEAGLIDLAFADADNGIAVGHLGKILRTRDGGQSWVQEYPPNVGGFDNINFIMYPSADKAIAAYGYGALIQFDGKERLHFPLFTEPRPFHNLPTDGVRIAWTAVEGAQTYQLQLSEHFPFSDVFYNPNWEDESQVVLDTTLSDTSLIVGGLQFANRYHARLRALAGPMTSDWREHFLFYTREQEDFIAPPTILHPLNQSFDNPTTLTVEWEHLNDEHSYDLRIFTMDGPVRSVVFERYGIAGNAVEVTGLQANTVFFIEILLHSSEGDSEWSSSFVTHWFETGGKATSVSETTVSGGGPGLLLYPQPARESVRILPGGTLSGPWRLELYDLRGVVRAAYELAEIPAEGWTLPTVALHSGWYLLRVRSDNRTFTQALIISK